MQFQDVDIHDMHALSPFFGAQTLHISDFSLGFQFMWHDALKPSYAIAENCLILREKHAGKDYFHYPLSRTGDRTEESAAIAAVERYCRDADLRAHFTNVPRSRLGDLVSRYGEALVTNNRRWRDYLYLSSDFRDFPGKKFAGQRNHVHKFEKNYPDARFVPAEGDLSAAREFLREYEGVQRGKHTYLAEEEMDEAFALLPEIGKLGLKAGAVEVGGKIVGLSVGEVCGDMLIVHIEKALREYEGIYPYLAQAFARAFSNTVPYINRMDDAGDAGLRKSKLQYNPESLVDKYNVLPKRAIDLISALPEIRTERLLLAPVSPADKAEYARLASDTERNRYWGYDWREDRTRRPSDGYFLKCAREDFREKREMPLGIYFGGGLVGEVVLHRFGYAAEAEIGVRLLPEAEGRGFAQEAVRAYTEYAFFKLNLERVEAKCFRENTRSRRTLSLSGMRETGSDGVYYYFVRTPSM